MARRVEDVAGARCDTEVGLAWLGPLWRFTRFKYSIMKPAYNDGLQESY